MPVFGEQEYPEDIRLKYRFLDLRRETLHRNIMTRVAVVADMRERMRALARPDAARHLAEIVLDLAGRRAAA